MIFDTIVVGLGGMGSSALYELARTGQNVLGLEQFTIPHEKGSSHGLSRIIRMAYFEHPSYIPLLKRSYDLWRRLEQESSEQLLISTGSIDASYPGMKIFEGALESCKNHQLDHEVLDFKSLSNRFPGYQLPEGMRALFQPQGGILLPEKAISEYVRLSKLKGAKVSEEEKVIDLERDSQGMRVTTSKNIYFAKNVVVTAGAWIGKLFPELASVAIPERQVVGWFRPYNKKVFGPDNFPVFNMQVDEGHFYGFPSIFETGFKIGKYHHLKEKVDPDNLDIGINRRDENILRECMRTYFPEANGDLLTAKACMFTNTPDGHFIVEKHDDWPVVIAGGFSGHGYKFCSVVGEIIADLISRGECDFNIELFSSHRFSREEQRIVPYSSF